MVLAAATAVLSACANGPTAGSRPAPEAAPAPVIETRERLVVRCPAEVTAEPIRMAPPAPAQDAVVTANAAGDAWIDAVLAWGSDGWARLLGAQGACAAAQAEEARP